jgi:hypothetical protein
MKRPPFDDPGAFRRRWSHLSAEQLRAESLRDPLIFAADHLPVDDRWEGTVVVVAEVDCAPAPVVIVIPDGPPAPEEEMCLGVLASVVAQLHEALGPEPLGDDDDYDDFPEPETTPVLRLGVVAHRLGSTAVNDIDRRWMRALGLVSDTLGIGSLGVVSRTRSGALVRIAQAAAA